jgi:small subunit ribosomal protein S20
MANHSSTEKAIRKIAKKSAINRNRRTKIRTYVKKSLLAIESGSKEEASKILISTQSEIMRGVSKGLIKKNTASRKISRLAKKLKARSLSVPSII